MEPSPALAVRKFDPRFRIELLKRILTTRVGLKRTVTSVIEVRTAGASRSRPQRRELMQGDAILAQEISRPAMLSSRRGATFDYAFLGDPA